MIGTSAARAWLIASIVCGITPSSAATTSTTMSVASAPRARIWVNAAWPGVSMNVIVLAVLLDLVGADVLGDPAGLAGDDVGVADLVEQRGLAVVDVAHDRDDRRPRLLVSSSSSLSSNSACSSISSCCPGSTSMMSAPISRANSSICSSVSVIVAVTISPLLSRKRTTSADVRFSFGPNSCADTPRSMTTVPSGTGASLRV